MTRDDIDECWNKFVAGDRKVFGEIYHSYKPRLTFFCLGKLKNVDLAENCATEALMKTYSYDKPEEIKNIENWLFSIAKNLCVSTIRKKKSHETFIKHSSTGRESFIKAEALQTHNKEDLDKIIRNELSKEEFEIWKLHADGFHNKEISIKLGIREKTVANRKSEIRLRLRTVLKDHVNPGKNRE